MLNSKKEGNSNNNGRKYQFLILEKTKMELKEIATPICCDFMPPQLKKTLFAT